jgi:hypothetical protein
VKTTFGDHAAANQINSLGFAPVGEEHFRNLCCRKARAARDERLDRVCHRDKVPTTIFPTRYWSVANLVVSHPSALHKHAISTRGGKPKQQADGTRYSLRAFISRLSLTRLARPVLDLDPIRMAGATLARHFPRIVY